MRIHLVRHVIDDDLERIPRDGLERVEARRASLHLAESVAVEPSVPLRRELGLQAGAMNDRLKGEALKEGLHLAPEKIRMVNTFDAHRLTHHAATEGRRAEMVERLFHAYHVEGAVLSDPAVLMSLAAEVGLDHDRARAVIEGDEYSVAVRDDEERASSFGITGVPFFAIDEKYGVSGAQPVEVFLGALNQAAAG